MPKPDYINLTYEEIMAEIKSWPDASAKLKSIDRLTEKDRKVLCGMMRSGKKMHEISAQWAAWGLPGSSPGTLRRMFRELEQKGY